MRHETLQEIARMRREFHAKAEARQARLTQELRPQAPEKRA